MINLDDLEAIPKHHLPAFMAFCELCDKKHYMWSTPSIGLAHFIPMLFCPLKSPDKIRCLKKEAKQALSLFIKKAGKIDQEQINFLESMRLLVNTHKISKEEAWDILMEEWKDCERKI